MAPLRMYWASSTANALGLSLGAVRTPALSRCFSSSVLASSHEWVKHVGSVDTIGITDHAQEKWPRPTRKNAVYHSRKAAQHTTQCFMGTTVPQGIKTFIQYKNSKAFEISAVTGPNNNIDIPDTRISDIFDVAELRQGFFLADLDPATAKLAIGFIGPFLSAFAFLFVVRIVMSWYPKLPVSKFPYVLAYAPTEPILNPTRKVIPPVGGVDITPVVWFGLLSFLNEILVGPQGLLILISQQR